MSRHKTSGPIKRFNNKDLEDQFRSFSRGPFTEILADMMAMAPTEQAIRAFAEEHPDRWVNAVKGLANLSGYHDKIEISGNILVQIAGLGDAQLIARLEELDTKLLELDSSEFEDETDEKSEKESPAQHVNRADDGEDS